MGRVVLISIVGGPIPVLYKSHTPGYLHALEHMHAGSTLLVTSMPLACRIDIAASQSVHQVGLFGLGLVQCKQVSVKEPPEAHAHRETLSR